MYGGGDGTMDTIRGLFTQGFGIGEVLEGLAQSLPEGLRQRLSANGIQGLLGRPYNGGSLKQTYEHLNALVQEHLRTKKAREVPFPEAIARLGEHAGENEDLRQAVKVLSEFNQEGALDDVPFELGLEHDQCRREVGGLNRPDDERVRRRPASTSPRPFPAAPERSSTSAPNSGMANSSPCSGRPAAARPRRCA